MSDSRPVVPVAPPAAPIPVSTLELRPGLRKLSTGLLVYGAIGIALAALALIALLYVGSRIEAVATRTTDQLEVVIGTIDDASTALTDAGATAGSFATTLQDTPETIRQAAGTVTSVRGTLHGIEDTLGGINILGNQPFGQVSAQFGKIASDLEGLDTRLNTVAESLEKNRSDLQANATSLDQLGTRLGEVADALRTGIVEDTLGDVLAIVMILTLLVVMWTAVPAIGAVLLGLWLRRVLA